MKIKKKVMLLSSYDFYKFCHSYQVQLGEWSSLENFEVLVIRNKILGIGSKSTIYELIVIRVFGNQAKTEMWVNKGDIPSVQNKQNDIFCDAGCGLLLDDFLVFFKNLVGNA